MDEEFLRNDSDLEIRGREQLLADIEAVVDASRFDVSIEDVIT